MNKFIYICDIHYGAKPISRKDDFCLAILKKLRYVFTVARKNKCHVIIGGDITDTFRLSTYILMPLFELFAEFDDIIFFIVRGNQNHDGSSANSPLSLLNMCFAGNVYTSDKNEFIDWDKFRLVFADNMSDPKSKEHLISGDKINILITHHLIVEKPTIYEHFLIDDFDTEFDIVTIADYHPKQGIIKKGKTTFVSTGALARKKNTASDTTRIPSFAYITETNIVLKDIPYEKDVFVDKIIEDEDNVDILDNVRKMTELIDMDLNQEDIKSSIEIYGKKMDCDSDTLDYVLKRLGE